EPSFPPHSHPFRMIDVVVEFDRERCTTIKSPTTGEVVRDDPNATAGAYPFALLLEAMAQAAIPLSGLPDEHHPNASADVPRPRAAVVVAGPGGTRVGLDGVRLLRPVRPGDRLLISARIPGRFGSMIRVRSVAEPAASPAGGEIVAEGEFTIALAERP